MSEPLGQIYTVSHTLAKEPGCVIHACTLGDGCEVGAGSVVADGAVVGNGARVEAGSYVGQGTHVPDNQVWGGKPARYIRSLSETEVTENSKVAPSQQALAQKHILLQNRLLSQKEDYEETTFYHRVQ